MTAIPTSLPRRLRPPRRRAFLRALRRAVAPCLGSALGVLLALGPRAVADDAAAGTVPEASGLVLDGRLDEAAWGGALRLAGASVEVTRPAASFDATAPDRAEIRPDVRVAVSGGRLWIGVALDDDAGRSIGFDALLAPDGAGAADATALAYAPEDPAAVRYVARGPRGSGRGAIRLEAAVDVSTPGHWSVEARVPLADLPPFPLRLALVVRTREGGVTASVPAGAAFAGPDHWARLVGPAAPAAPVEVDAQTIAAEDAADVRRLRAWQSYLAASERGLDAMAKGAGLASPWDTAVSKDDVRQAVERALLGPLEEALAARPDLAAVHVLEAETLAALGEPDRARAELDRAEALVPGLREARFVRAMRVEGPALAGGPPGGPSAWDGALARARSAVTGARGPYERDGAGLGLGLLLLGHGDYPEAAGRLGPLAKRFPFEGSLVLAAERAARAGDLAADERQARAHEADLPRVRIVTARGPIEAVLYEDEQPNTVASFVWLARHRFYDGLSVSETTPFLFALLGDPRTREGAPEGRAPGPGYAVPVEAPRGAGARAHPPLRGSLAMVHAGDLGVGSRFAILEGTALHLDGQVIVFGRVAKGQDVADALEKGDRVDRVEVVRVRDGVEYRPQAMDGRPAPDPQ